MSGETLNARRVVLATGARLAPLNLDGEERLNRNADLLDLARSPEHIVFIGAATRV